MVRALEIRLLTGKKASELRRRKPARPAIPAKWFGLARPREEMYYLAEQRIDHWLNKGWLEEVKALLHSGVSAKAPAMQAIGYSHLVKNIQGEYSYQRAVELIKRDTRRYIKRQMTWFRAEKRVTWLDSKALLEEIPKIIPLPKRI